MPANAFKINSSLWQGAFPQPGPGLSAEGFTALVLCAAEWQPPKDMYPGLEVIHASNTDNGQPITPEQLNRAKSAAVQAASVIDKGGKVLSTCAGGRNRSGLVSALTLYLVQRCSGVEAIHLVRNAYNMAPPGALSAVPSFERALCLLPFCTDREVRLSNLERLTCF